MSEAAGANLGGCWGNHGCEAGRWEEGERGLPPQTRLPGKGWFQAGDSSAARASGETFDLPQNCLKDSRSRPGSRELSSQISAVECERVSQAGERARPAIKALAVPPLQMARGPLFTKHVPFQVPREVPFSSARLGVARSPSSRGSPQAHASTAGCPLRSRSLFHVHLMLDQPEARGEEEEDVSPPGQEDAGSGHEKPSRVTPT